MLIVAVESRKHKVKWAEQNGSSKRVVISAAISEDLALHAGATNALLRVWQQQ